MYYYQNFEHSGQGDTLRSQSIKFKVWLSKGKRVGPPDLDLTLSSFGKT